MRWALLVAIVIELVPAIWSVVAHWSWPLRPIEKRVLRVRLEPAARSPRPETPVTPPPIVDATPPTIELSPPPDEPSPLATETGRPSRRPTPRPTPPRSTPFPSPLPTPGPDATPAPTAIPSPPPEAPASDVAAANAPPPAEGDDSGKPSTEPKPIYPRTALHDGVEGHVLVRFTVSDAGTVTDVRILEADPPDVFERSVLRAASRYRFDATGHGYAIDRDFVFKIRKPDP